MYSPYGKSNPNTLTDQLVASTTPHSKPYKLFDGAGMFLLVMPDGARYWRFKYRFAGKEKALSLGVYPEVTLPEARLLREELRALLVDGIDPSAARKAEHAGMLARQHDAVPRFRLDSDGALAFRFGIRSVVLTPAETVELRAFLDATRSVQPKVGECR